jgi:UDP-4-amino-4-deoxy-L-arabinose-oxoglutarate aminotransferase
MILHSQPWILPEDAIILNDIVKSKNISKSNITIELENTIAKKINKNYVLATGNATQAQMLILMALGVGENDEVILPSYVCDKVLKAVLSIGAKPIICDVEKHFVITPNSVSRYITKKTKAIILVHIYGINAYDTGFDKFDVPIIEDLCHTFGKTLNGDLPGSNTDFAFTSFHGTKMLGAGEGGMLFLNNKELFDKVVQFKSTKGFFTSGNELISSLVIKQIDRFEENLKKRYDIAKFYNENLPKELTSLMLDVNGNTVYFKYILKTNKSFIGIKKKYEEKGIAVRQAVDNLNHRNLNLQSELYSQSEYFYNNTFSIPIYPHLTQSEMKYIVDVTNEFFLKGVI